MKNLFSKNSVKQQDTFAISAFCDFFLWGICSALAITICTLVDALLVGNLVGADGLAVVNLSTPVFLIYGVFGVTLGVGGNVRIGKCLGSADVEAAQTQFRDLMGMGLVAGAVCMLVGACFSTEIYGLLGADATLVPVVTPYLQPVFYAAPLFVLYHILSLSVGTDGEPRRAALAAAVVIATNLSLDVLFMQVMRLGIGGASLSLCIAEAMGVAVLLPHFFHKNALLKLGVQMPRLHKLREFLSSGFGVGSRLLFQGVVMLCFNGLLMDDSQQGVYYVAVFGVIYTISLLPGAFFDGGSTALSTVVAIFSGEKDKDSVLVVLRQALWMLCLLGGGFTLLFLLCPSQLLLLFGLDATQSATRAVQVFALSLVLTGVHMAMTAFWQAIGRNRLAGTFSVTRNLVLMLVMGWLLIPSHGILGLAYAYLATECLCFVGTLVVYFFASSQAYLTECYKSVFRSFERTYPVEKDSVAQISEDLEGICDQWEMDMKQSFFVNLIVEELVLNIIKFALTGEDKQRYVAIKLLDNDGEYILRIRDNVKAYNPFESQGDDVDAGAMRLITTKAAYYDYQRKLIFNYLYLIL